MPDPTPPLTHRVIILREDGQETIGELVERHAFAYAQVLRECGEQATAQKIEAAF